MHAPGNATLLKWSLASALPSDNERWNFAVALYKARAAERDGVVVNLAKWEIGGGYKVRASTQRGSEEGSGIKRERPPPFERLACSLLFHNHCA